MRASGHFKVYINPCLLSLNSSSLGFRIGPICTTAVCVADDTYLLSNSPSGLQGALDVINHYAKRYQLKFNAGKTKIVVTGSKQDMSFYKDTTPWTLDGEVIKVVDSNEHLGLVVSGTDEEKRNVDENIFKCRTSSFALLGPAFSYKCLLPPTLQIHLWRLENLKPSKAAFWSPSTPNTTHQHEISGNIPKQSDERILETEQVVSYTSFALPTR